MGKRRSRSSNEGRHALFEMEIARRKEIRTGCKSRIGENRITKQDRQAPETGLVFFDGSTT